MLALSTCCCVGVETRGTKGEEDASGSARLSRGINGLPGMLVSALGGSGVPEISTSWISSYSGKVRGAERRGLGGGEGLLHALRTRLARMTDGSVS